MLSKLGSTRTDSAQLEWAQLGEARVGYVAEFCCAELGTVWLDLTGQGLAGVESRRLLSAGPHSTGLGLAELGPAGLVSSMLDWNWLGWAVGRARINLTRLGLAQLR